MPITDVLLGAVGFAINQIGTNSAKLALVKHIQEGVGCEELKRHEGAGSRFSIERFDFSKTQPLEAKGDGAKEKQAPTNPNQAREPATPTL